MAGGKVKKRNWAAVLYPESLPADWMDTLQATGLPVVVSPLHDKDIDPTGEPKKAHYHAIMCYPGPTTYSVVASLIVEQLHQPAPKPVESVKGYYRYLTHADNPDKAQYDPAGIVHLNGWGERDYVGELTRSEIARLKREIQQLIRDNCITEYCDLLDILMDAGDAMADHYDVAASNTILWTAYLTSMRYKSQQAAREGGTT